MDEDVKVTFDFIRKEIDEHKVEAKEEYEIIHKRIKEERKSRKEEIEMVEKTIEKTNKKIDQTNDNMIAIQKSMAGLGFKVMVSILSVLASLCVGLIIFIYMNNIK